jgi:heat shock protein HslJ
LTDRTASSTTAGVDSVWSNDMQQRRVGRLALMAAVVAVMGLADAASAQSSFPYDSELRLDVPPMRGSKRVPSIEIASNGAAEIVLWCNTVKAQLVVASDTITVITGSATANQCPPERLRGDEDLLVALSQATNWRWDGETLVMTGGKPVRFRLQTN